jgi:hypothetical protein
MIPFFVIVGNLSGGEAVDGFGVFFVEFSVLAYGAEVDYPFGHFGDAGEVDVRFG